MAINTVGARYEGFIFDGENSRDYGVYVTDVKVFGTPVRNVEMVTIPGRNGAFALDNGNFENIEIKYTCAMSADTPADFNDAISDLRNMLASRIGYKRLEDEINTSEYRMAVYKGGLDVPTLNKETGTFDVVFDCKPQRFLKSGETAVDVTSTITNPTLFDASPLLTVEGYGDITINGKTITVEAVPTGNVLLGNKTSINAQWTSGLHTLVKVGEIVFNDALLNAGDSIVLDETAWAYTFTIKKTTLGGYVDSVSISNQTGTGATTGTQTATDTAVIATTIPAQVFTAGTSKTVSHSYDYNVAYNGGSSASATNNIEIRYNGTDTVELWASRVASQTNVIISANGSLGALNGDSTVLVSGSIYIDTDIGEAYWNNGEIVSANFAVSMVELPTLSPGVNATSKSNTFTTCKITPRWWTV